MMKIKNDTFLRALKKQPIDYTPVWMMRQAGRYLPEYRKVREKAGDFLTLCKTPELACEVTLQPLARFPLDAAILFSDILTIPDAMGLGLSFIEGEGPVFSNPIKNTADVERLPMPDPMGDLRYVMDAVTTIKQHCDSVPLIGFSGSPWTLACYMIEGGSSKLFKKAKSFLYNEPESMHVLLNKLSLSIIDYLSAQIDSGVDAVQIFDTWGGVLTTSAYHEFSLAYMAQIVKKLQVKYPEIPIILFTKQAGRWLSSIAATGCTAVGLDWTIDLHTAREEIGNTVALQGNLDPMILFAKPSYIEQEVARLLTSFGKGSGHIFNLGHGIEKETPIAHVAVFIESVHRLSRPYHQP
jgi:uroporphyrinogen decarboxylase